LIGSKFFSHQPGGGAIVELHATTYEIDVEPGYEVYAIIDTADDGYKLYPGSYFEIQVADGGAGALRVERVSTYQFCAANTVSTFNCTGIIYDPNGVYDVVTKKATIPLTPYSTFVPKFKQKDFLLGLVRAFNLIIEPDRSNTRHFFIEACDIYYDQSTVIRDWTRRLDLSKEVKYEPMADLQNRTFNYTYTADNDLYGNEYADKYKEVFGSHTVTIDNDFVDGETTVELPFSPTPLVTMRKGTGTSTTSFVITKLIYDRDGTDTGVETNLRLLFFKYKQLPNDPTAGQETWYFGNSIYSYYPYAGHFDDPYDPTMDLNFGVAQSYYYSPANLPSDNLYTLYYERQIEELASVNSSLMTGYFRLGPRDLVGIQFSDRILVDGVYYRLNKIDGFDAGGSATTRVELSKCIDIRFPISPTAMTIIK
jgi:hypothetical protein